MNNKLLEEGYILIAGGRDMTRIQREYKLAAFKLRTNAPGDFTPGRGDDKSEGFEAGSEIINGEGSIFKCIDSTTGKASWIKIGDVEDLTEESYLHDVIAEAQKEAETKTDGSGDTKVTGDKSDGSEGSDEEDEDPETEDEASGEEETAEDEEPEESEPSNSVSKELESEEDTEKQEEKSQAKRHTGPDILQTDSGPNKGRTPLPESVPYYKYLSDKNDIETVEELTQIAKSDDDALEDLSYMNSERAQAVKEWLFDSEE